MSKTIRNRKQGHHLFANSGTNKFRRQKPKTSWDQLKVFQADGAGDFWGTNPLKYERKRLNKQNRKNAKKALDTRQCKDVIDWDGFESICKSEY